MYYVRAHHHGTCSAFCNRGETTGHQPKKEHSGEKQNDMTANAFTETDHSYPSRTNTVHHILSECPKAGGVCPTGSTTVRKQDEQLLQKVRCSGRPSVWQGRYILYT